MKLVRYLVVGKSPNRKPTTRLTTQWPSLGRNEVSVKLDLNLPDRLFENPAIEASISVPENILSPKQIPVELLQNIESVISRELALDMKVSFVEEVSE